ncbi:hypothetical protein QVD17_18928 [Tagetes erecta]|uniref:Uncharacterized protein n=1 Tax=Tagetes erecta TaxID=13708 RepID=A0AAD8KIJ2_TARER|nr:hypothetical protein QVD17_18928 [Tagetes erecta]
MSPELGRPEAPVSPSSTSSAVASGPCLGGSSPVGEASNFKAMAADAFVFTFEDDEKTGNGKGAGDGGIKTETEGEGDVE